MNREEIIKQLTELQTRMASEVDTFKFTSRIERIEEINDLLKSNAYERKLLEEKLQNPENYIDNTSIYYMALQQEAATELLNAAKRDLDKNQTSLETTKKCVENFERLIKEAQKQIEKLKDDNIELGLAVKRAELIDDKDDIKACSEQKSANLTKIEDLRKEIEDIKIAIEQQKAKAKDLNNGKGPLQVAVKKAESRVENIKNEIEEVTKGRIDLARKEADKARIATLDAEASALTMESGTISYDFESEIKGIIEEYEQGSLSDEDLKARLVDIKSRLPKDYLQADEEKRTRELKQNHQGQASCQSEIEKLEAKLASQDNYKMGNERIAEINLKKQRLNDEIQENEAIILRAENQNNKYNADILVYQQIIALAQKELIDLEVKIGLANGKNPTLSKELEAKKAMEFQIIREGNAELDEIVRLRNMNNEVIKNTKEENAKKNTTIERYEKYFANGIDLASMELDKSKLERAKSTLALLQKREAILNNSLINELNLLIGEEQNTADKNGQELPFPSEGNVDVDVDALTDEEKAALDLFNKNNNKKTNPNKEINNDVDLEGQVQVKGKREPNKKQKDKASSSKFFQNLKKWFKRTLIGIFVVAMLAAAHHHGSKLIKPATTTETSIDDDKEKNDETVEKNNGSKTTESETTEKENTNNSQENTDSEEKENKDSKDTIENLKNNNSSDDKENNNGENTSGKENQNNGGASDQRSQEEQAAYSETTEGSDEKAADPVDPNTIPDPNGNTGGEHADPVDPGSIPDPYPGQGDTGAPNPSQDEGEKTTEDGVTGEETVDDDDYGEIHYEELDAGKVPGDGSVKIPEKDPSKVGEDDNQNTSDDASKGEEETEVSGVTGEETVDDDDFGDIHFEDQEDEDAYNRNQDENQNSQDENDEEKSDEDDKEKEETVKQSFEARLSEGEAWIDGEFGENRGVSEEYVGEKQDAILDDNVNEITYDGDTVVVRGTEETATEMAEAATAEQVASWEAEWIQENPELYELLQSTFNQQDENTTGENTTGGRVR